MVQWVKAAAYKYDDQFSLHEVEGEKEIIQVVLIPHMYVALCVYALSHTNTCNNIFQIKKVATGLQKWLRS